MRYYLIAGEASGDLHASHLMRALRRRDPEATFRCLGGDLMREAGGTLCRHYRELAYMGFIPVLLHARTILRGLRECKADIVAWRPDVVILIDYPGFNLKVARYVRQHTHIPVYYYIAPKLWAWKEYRIAALKRDVDELFSILPFEKDFFEGRHHYPIHYVGNPTVDEIAAYIPAPLTAATPHIALLPGSRRQEIRDNLQRMAEAARPLVGEYRLLVAGAPGIEAEYYQRAAQGLPVEVVYGRTYDLVRGARAALVTSGTATLETALLRCPQVVCYYMRAGRLASLARRLFIKIPYISLVNLVAGREVVPELVAHEMTPLRARRHLLALLPDDSAERQAQLDGYELMAQRLGPPGAPERAAEKMLQLLGKTSSSQG